MPLDSLVNPQGEAHRSRASLLEVCQQQQALQLAPFMLLLTLDLMPGELQGRRRSPPLFQQEELLPGGARRGEWEGWKLSRGKEVGSA